jgi:hypothetical protein
LPPWPTVTFGTAGVTSGVVTGGTGIDLGVFTTEPTVEVTGAVAFDVSGRVTEWGTADFGLAWRLDCPPPVVLVIVLVTVLVADSELSPAGLEPVSAPAVEGEGDSAGADSSPPESVLGGAS